MIASIILILYLTGVVGLETVIPLLYIGGFTLIIAEFFLASMGIIAFNGVLSLFIAYALQTENATLFGYPVDWGMVFGIAFFEFLLLAAMVLMIRKMNAKKVTVGAESLVGAKAVVENWDGNKGKVFIQGEIWNAVSQHALDLQKEDTVTVDSVDQLTLTITTE